jgi:tetratricopeptide (TPR) repeat protein
LMLEAAKKLGRRGRAGVVPGVVLTPEKINNIEKNRDPLADQDAARSFARRSYSPADGNAEKVSGHIAAVAHASGEYASSGDSICQGRTGATESPAPGFAAGSLPKKTAAARLPVAIPTADAKEGELGGDDGLSQKKTNGLESFVTLGEASGDYAPAMVNREVQPGPAAATAAAAEGEELDPELQHALDLYLAERKGDESYRAGKMGEALLYYDEALYCSQSPAHHDAACVAVFFLKRAMAHTKLGNLESAEADCTRCLELDPS